MLKWYWVRIIGEQMKLSLIYKFFAMLFVSMILLAGCAAPVMLYPVTTNNQIHYAKDPATLNCNQLNEARIQVSSLINTVAVKSVEEADRSSAKFLMGISVSNPATGKDFIGFQSEGVDPTVNEYRRLNVLLEEVEDLQLLKCTRTNLDN
jgi:hypothetical protein